MKKVSMLVAGITGLLLFAVATPTFAADKTIKGEAKCAKCALKQGDKCQTVIETEGKDGKKVTYVLADNEVAKDFHSKVCKGAQKVTATGTVKKLEDGKRELTVSKISVDKE